MTMNPMQEVPELPTLDSGIHLLETDSRTSGALQSLVLDTLLTRETSTAGSKPGTTLTGQSRTCVRVVNNSTQRNYSKLVPRTDEARSSASVRSL